MCLRTWRVLGGRESCSRLAGAPRTQGSPQWGGRRAGVMRGCPHRRALKAERGIQQHTESARVQRALSREHGLVGKDLKVLEADTRRHFLRPCQPGCDCLGPWRRTNREVGGGGTDGAEGSTCSNRRAPPLRALVRVTHCFNRLEGNTRDHLNGCRSICESLTPLHEENL